MKYAYIKKNGKITNKFVISDLSKISNSSYDEIIEVQSESELSAIVVYKEPYVLTSEDEVKQKISAEKDLLAIESLKLKGELEEVDGKIKKKKKV